MTSRLTSDGRGVNSRRLPARRADKISTPSRRRPKYRLYDNISAWILLAPALILFSIFIALPTVAALVLSLFAWRFFDTPSRVGLDKFTRMFADPETWQSLGVTFQFGLLGVAPTIILGFRVAVLLNVGWRGVRLLRVLFFIPVVVSVAVPGVIWNFLYDPRQGPIGSTLKAFGQSMPDVLNTELFALPALVIMMVWAGMPIVIILYLAGLQRISPDIYDAAALDGAGPWRTLWSITWPNVTTTTFVVFVLQIIAFVSGSLDLALIMTRGGPLGATRPLGLYAYEQAFNFTDVGYATALSVLQLVVIVVIVGGVQLVIRRRSR